MKFRVGVLAKKKGVTQVSVAEAVKLSPPQISRIVTHKSGTSMKSLESFAEFFECSPAEIIDGPHILTDDEQSLLDGYRGASDEGREMLTEIAQKSANRRSNGPHDFKRGNSGRPKP